MVTLRLGLRVVSEAQWEKKKHARAAESGSPCAPGPRPACAGRSHRAALAENAAPGSLPGKHFLHYFSEEILTGERGIRTAENTPAC